MNEGLVILDPKRHDLPTIASIVQLTAGLKRNLLIQSFNLFTVTLATLSSETDTVAKESMKKRDTWTGRNTTESGLMGMSQREMLPIPKRNPPNPRPKSDSNHSDRIRVSVARG